MNRIQPFEFGQRITSKRSEVGSFLTNNLWSVKRPIAFAMKFSASWVVIQPLINLLLSDMAKFEFFSDFLGPITFSILIIIFLPKKY